MGQNRAPCSQVSARPARERRWCRVFEDLQHGSACRFMQQVGNGAPQYDPVETEAEKRSPRAQKEETDNNILEFCNIGPPKTLGEKEADFLMALQAFYDGGAWAEAQSSVTRVRTPDAARTTRIRSLPEGPSDRGGSGAAWWREGIGKC